jgi:dTDP-4-dehydrorhamnose 3,5-epimerase
VSVEASARVAGSLPHDVRLSPLVPHRDERGTFVELFREEWETGVHPVQWNAVDSEQGVLRGVHVHLRHDDYLAVIRGSATVGLRDLRDDSPTAGAAACVELGAEDPTAISIPHGVAHGFHFTLPSTHIYAVSSYWDPADELGCRWDDPGLGIPWPQRQARISQRDADLPPLEVLLGELRSAWADG